MALCGSCKEPCSCLIQNDGVKSGHPELGRNFTQVDGKGTEENPFTISFYDQNEFRPKAMEVTFEDVLVPNGTFGINLREEGMVTDVTYQSPNEFLIRYPSIESTVYVYASGSFYVIGATATFDQVADANTTNRVIVLVGVVESPIGNPVEVAIGAHQTPGGLTDPITVTCEGYLPGLFMEIPTLGTVSQSFNIHLYQTSGAPLMARDIKMWMAQI